MRKLKLLIPYLLVVSHLATATENDLPWPESVVFIVSENKPVKRLDVLTQALSTQGINIDVYELGAVERFEASLSKNLPRDEDAAEAAFKHRIQKIGQETFNQQLREAYQGQLYLIRHRIERFPAVVFDESWVVFGIDDALRALTIYQTHQRSLQKESAHD